MLRIATIACLGLNIRCAPYPGQSAEDVNNASQESQGHDIRREARRSAEKLARPLRGVVAVLEFPVIGGVENKELSREISEIVTSSLAARPNFSVVERSQLSQVLKERAYRQALEGMTDEAAASIGRELRVNAVVFGTIATGSGSPRLYARAVEVGTAKILQTYSTHR